ncbi:GGDEF domain-containing protein [Candidatus Woesearchaeota archaeon]|nr:GGDEF domain-containing protein [Candidatus Woesearchaeota archaeon]
MLPNFAKTELWRTLSDNLATQLNTSIIIEKATYGKLSFFQELRNRQHDQPYAALQGIKYISVPIESATLIIGPWKTNEPHALPEELAEARQKLPDWKDHHEDLVCTAISQATVAATHAHHLNDALTRAKLLLEFNKAVGQSKTSEQALYNAVQFLATKFKAANVNITAHGKQARNFDTTQAGKEVEERVIQHVKTTKSTCTINNIHADFMLEGIKDKEKLAQCALGIPIMHDRELTGQAILTSEQPLPLENISEVLYELASYLNRLNEYEQAQTNAKTDTLTGLNNRAELAKLDLLLAQLSGQAQSITTMMLDADNFKNYNDSQGHQAGDKVLQNIASIIRKNVPEEALTCRYGGEEFLIALPNYLPQKAKDIAENIRQAVEQECPITISIGLITCMNSSASRETLVKEADEALYRAKHLGKNKVIARLMVDKTLGVIDG